MTIRSILLTAAFLLYFNLTPPAWTQYPPAPASVVTGSTLGASLRNAAAATQNQAGIVRRLAYDWGRRATSGAYQAQHFQHDFASLLSQFQTLRANFNVLGSLALQLGRPRADNAVAELDAGLNVIAELFGFLDQQFAAGMLDRATLARTCSLFNQAMREWEQELRKNSSRLGVVW